MLRPVGARNDISREIFRIGSYWFYPYFGKDGCRPPKTLWAQAFRPRLAPTPPSCPSEFYPYFGNGGRRSSEALRAQALRPHSAPAPPLSLRERRGMGGGEGVIGTFGVFALTPGPSPGGRGEHCCSAREQWVTILGLVYSFCQFTSLSSTYG